MILFCVWKMVFYPYFFSTQKFFIFFHLSVLLRFSLTQSCNIAGNSLWRSVNFYEFRLDSIYIEITQNIKEESFFLLFSPFLSFLGCTFSNISKSFQNVKVESLIFSWYNIIFFIVNNFCFVYFIETFEAKEQSKKELVPEKKRFIFVICFKLLQAYVTLRCFNLHQWKKFFLWNFVFYWWQRRRRFFDRALSSPKRLCWKSEHHHVIHGSKCFVTIVSWLELRHNHALWNVHEGFTLITTEQLFSYQSTEGRRGIFYHLNNFVVLNSKT